MSDAVVERYKRMEKLYLISAFDGERLKNEIFKYLYKQEHEGESPDIIAIQDIVDSIIYKNRYEDNNSQEAKSESSLDESKKTMN